MISDSSPRAADLPAAQPAVVDIGNSSIALGLWADGQVKQRRDFPVDQIQRFGEALKALGAETTSGFLSGVAIASVVPELLERVCGCVEDELNLAPLIVGRQIPLPIELSVRRPETVGVDRICCAAAAYDRRGEACVVVDFGTAITVDYVDDSGRFAGGAILPGAAMQARALHEYTAQLPHVETEKPDEVIGRDTAAAIQTGIYHGTSGAVRGIVEAYAAHLGRWPPVIATGGDAKLISEACDIFEVIVPDLCLIGVGVAYAKRLADAVEL
ncbi:MAG: type III pantothenate kinase [Planctomycetes bacterium]|nr:type III pantothenate kinase [Planctomycetota bacterium]